MPIFTRERFLLLESRVCKFLSGVLVVAINLLFCQHPLFAEGSKELNANGGDRAYLACATNSSASGIFFTTQGLVRVYVNSGETIYLGSSAMGVYGGNTVLVSPSGVVYNNTRALDGTNGFISTYAQETAGPVGVGNGGFTPYKHTATETGIWSVFFIGSTSNLSNYSTPKAANTTWNKTSAAGAGNLGDNSGDIAAFDVSVSASASATLLSQFIKGRAYMNVFQATLGSLTGRFFGKFDVLTNDGYDYQVDGNGMAGFGFTFFSNNKGYKNGSGAASYLSVNSSSTATLQDPRTVDTPTDITHKLFFNTPASDLPTSASIRSNSGQASNSGTAGTTWLKVTPIFPAITNLKFTGNEGTLNAAGISPMNGVISFDANQAGSYTITIDVDNNGVDAGDVTLTGNAVSGTNNVAWDGKDGLGAIVNGTINASSIKVLLKAGEVHFPFIDVENNPSGIKITRTIDASSTVYWNDVNITTAAGATASSPKTELSGINSSGAGSNGHKFGSTSYNSSDFGNQVGLDTWAYLMSTPVASASPVLIRTADLQVVSVTSDKTSYCIGDPITYTVSLKNNGPDNVTGATAAFNFPSEITLSGTPAYTTSNVTIVSNSATSTRLSAVLDMQNQGTLTATIQGVVMARPASGSLQVSATILRPADVYDPDATNPDNTPPTDPDLECNSGTAGCNNIVSQSAAVPLSDISISGAANATITEGNAVGSTKDMSFTVSLSAASTCTLTVNYALQHGTTNDADFDFTAPYAKTGSLTFAPGQTSKTITFKVKQDLMVEASETFTVQLSGAGTGGQIVTANATGTVNNDDIIGTVTITAVNGQEGTQNGSFTFTLPANLSFDVDTPIPFTLGTGSSTATGGGTDYTPAVTTSILLPAGQNSVTLDLAVINDALIEGTETVEITPGVITNTYGALTVATPIPVLNILDDDAATLTIGNATITEGDSGTQNLSFNVTLNNATGSAFTVNYATANGTALAGEDYVATSGTLTFTGTATTQTILVPVNGDLKVEPNETFTLTLSGLNNTFGGLLTLSGSPATGTINDNDNTAANKTIHITPADGKEQGTVPGMFTFGFPAGVSIDQPTTVNFSLSGGTALSGVDFTGGGLTSVIIPAGTNSAVVSFPVIDDAILEGTETIVITAGTLTNGSYTGITADNSPQTLNIEDNDAATVTIGDASVIEGDNGTVDLVFNITLDKAPGTSFTLPFTVTDGTATLADNDYLAPASTLLTFGTTGPFPKTVQAVIRVKGDQRIEPDETLIVTLGSPSTTFGGLLTVSGTTGTSATGTIVDDDNIAGNKAITLTKTDGYEGVPGSKASFTFSFPAGITVGSATQISYTLGGTATGAGVDYTGAISGTVTIPAGAGSVTLELPIVDDVIAEGAETVIATVTGIVNASPAYTGFTTTNSGLALNIQDDENTVLLSSPSTVIEGNTGTTLARFTVSLANPTSGPFSVSFHTADGTATAGEDYVAQSNTLNFNGNVQVQYIDIVVNGDLKIEPDEAFTVTLDNLSDNFGGTLQVSPPVTMSIVDDDNTVVNKQVTIAKTDGSEGGAPGTFTLSFPAGVTLPSATTITYTLTGTANGAGVDYTGALSGNVVIAANQQSATLTLPVIDDSILEGTETVILNVTSVTNPDYTAMGAANSPQPLDILDNDAATPVMLTISQLTDGSEPGTDAQFSVSFPAGITSSVPTVVNYTVSGTATAGSDYTALSGTVVIPANQHAVVIAVPVLDDQLIEPSETVGLTLTGATNTLSAVTVDPLTAVAAIADDDNIPAGNVITLAKITDGAEPGTAAQFKVSFPAGISSAVATTVTYTVGGTATAGLDYTALSGTAIIPAGQNSATIDVLVLDDAILEPAETVTLTLTAATNTLSALTVQPASAVSANIADDDNTVLNNRVTVVRTADGAEPSSNGRFTISYPSGITSSAATQVTYTVAGTATPGADYTALTGTAVIPAGQNAVTVDVLVTDDSIIEATETVQLTLTAATASGFTVIASPTTATLNLADDDNTPPNNIVVTLSKITDGAEPGTAAQFKVAFPAGITSSTATTLTYAASGSATAGADYTALSGTVVIPANQNSAIIAVPVLNDQLIEGTETVELTLNSAVSSIISTIATFPSSAVSADILDDDYLVPANSVLTLSKVADGAEPGTNAQFKVSYPAGISASAPTTITYSVAGTATPGTDYTALSGTLVIPANQNSAIINVPVLDDALIEPTETVEIALTAAGNSLTTVTWAAIPAIADLADDDHVAGATVITLTKMADGAEPATNGQFKVSYPAGITSSVATTITYTVAGTATAGTDYTALSGTLVIPANQNSVLIHVPVLDDRVVEPVETVVLTLTAATSSIATLTVQPAVGVSLDIADDDDTPTNNQVEVTKITDGAEPGTNGQFKVSFPIGVTSSVATTVTYTIAGTATAGADYTPLTGTTTISANQNSATIDVPVLDDQLIEPSETVVLTLTGATNTLSTLTVDPAPATVAIADDDNLAANNTITLTKITDGAEPGTNGQFKVTFPIGVTSSVATTVTYTIAGTATAGTDYTALSGTVIIPALANSATIDVPVLDDQLIEPSETVVLTLASATNALSTLTVDPAPATVTIADDDNLAANNIITLTKVTDGAEPGTNGQFKVSFPIGVTSSVATTVTYTIAGTATAGADYTALSGTIVIPANQNSTLVGVPVLDDQLIEPSETVVLTLTGASNALSTLTVDPAPATVTIADDDNLAANNTITLTKITDGAEPSTNGQFKVSFPIGVTSSVATTVTYTIAGTATPGSDYTTLSGTVIIPALANSAIINVPVLDDQLIEPFETVVLTLTGASNALSTITVDPAPATVTIADDDNLAANNTIVLAKIIDGAEPGTNGQFQVSFPAGITSSVATTVTYTIAGTATAGADYTVLSGTVIIPALANSAIIDVPVLDDQLIEPFETVVLTLTGASNALSTITVDPAPATVTIADDDNLAANNTITLTKITDGAEPGTNGQFKVSFPIGVTSSVATTVTYTIAGMATAGTDYTTLSGTITIPANQNSTLVDVPVLDDQLIEPSETVVLTLTGATNALSTLTVDSSPATVTIADDDNLAANNTITLTKVTDGTEPGTNGQFKVSFPIGVTSSVATTVTYTIAGTATAGTDYTTLSGTVTIPALANSATIDVPVLDDQLIEPLETVVLTLTSATNSLSTLTVDSSPATVTIADDDNFAANNTITLIKITDGAEPGTNGQFKVSFPIGVTSSVATTITYTIAGTATAGIDYTALSGTVVIPALANSALINVPVLDDQLIEPSETVVLTLTGASNSLSTLTVDSSPATVAIADDDNLAANNTITLTKITDGAEPGTNGQFKVSFPAGVTSSVATTVTYTIAGTATAGTDYTALSGTVVIPALANSALINVPVLDDQLIEPSETVVLTLTAANNTLSTLTVDSSPATVAIADDDNLAANNTITLTKITDGAEPGTNGQFKVSFPIGVTNSAATTITYTIAGTATPGSDYTTLSGTVIIPALANSAIIDVPVLDDQLIEPSETVVLTLSAATNALSTLAVDPASATVTIADDDNLAANNTITLIKVTDGAEPGTNGQFKVSLPIGVTSSVATTITYTIAGTATAGIDYTALSGTVVIPALANSALINVPVLDDQLIEPLETVVLTLTSATNSLSTLTVDSSPATVTIADDDNFAANNTITLIKITDGAEPGTNGQFKVSFPIGVTSSVATTVTYTIAGTATAGTDYTALSGTVIIPALANSATIDVPVLDDQLIEPSETVVLTLTGATNTLSTLTVDSSPATVAIADDDNLAANNTITLTKITDGAEPGTNGQFKVSFPIGVTNSAATTITYTIAGTATPGSDYTTLSGTVIIPALANSAIIDVPVLDDQLIEPSETVVLTLTGATNALSTLTVDSAPATVAIADDDNLAANNTIILTKVSDGAEPGTNGQFKVSFPIGVTNSAATTITYTIAGAATAGADYTVLSGTVIIPALANSATIDVSVLDDQLIEPSETVVLTLTGASNALSTLTVDPAPATVTIADDDNLAANNTITLTKITDGAEPGTNGQFKVSFPIGVTNSAATTITYTIAGTATAGTDYTVLSGTVIIPALANSATIDVSVLDDQLIEPSETVVLTLTGATNALSTLTVDPAPATVTIADDDNLAANNTITLTKITDGAEPGTNDQFKVSFPAGVSSSVATTLHYTVAGTATAGTDYTALSGTIVIPANQNSALIDVHVLDDAVIELTETLTLTLVDAANTILPAVPVDTAAVTASILDDDNVPANRMLKITGTNGREGGTDAKFTFSLPAGLTLATDLALPFSFGGTAIPGTDYKIPTPAPFLPAGQNTAILPLQINDDDLVEDAEQVALVPGTITSVYGTFTLDPASLLNLAIADNDTAALRLSGPIVIAEGHTGTTTASLSVTLDKATSGSFTLAYATADSTATAADHDYVPVSGSLQFAGTAGETHTLSVAVNGDKKIERDELVKILLSQLSQTFGNRLIVPIIATTITVTNDDAGTLVITPLNGGEGTIAAGYAIGFSDPEVTADMPLTIGYTLSGEATGTGIDYTENGHGQLEIAANTTGTALVLAVTDDLLTEGTESVRLTVDSTLTLPYGIGLPASQTLSLADNDESTVTISNATLKEGNSGTENMQFTVLLNKATAAPFTVNWFTAAGTATAGEDYVEKTGTLSFDGIAGETKTIEVPVNGDQKIEQNETFTTTLRSVSNSFGGRLTLPAPEATGTIVDDDLATLTLTRVADGAEPGTPVRFKLGFATPGVTSSEPLTVQYTPGGTAINGQDYTLPAGNFTVPADSSEVLIDVPVLDDERVEFTETVALTLVSAGSTHFQVPVNTAAVTATITDNDHALLTVSPATVPEGDSATVKAVFKVTLTADTPTGFTVAYATADGTARVADNDYEPVSGTLNFNGTAGESYTIEVLVNGDRRIERDEVFHLSLTPSVTFDGRLTTAPLPADGTIIDDDNNPANKVIIVSATHDGAEGGDNPTIKFSFPPGITIDEPTQLTFTSGGTATGGVDYEGFDGPVVIPAGVNSVILPIRVIDDALVEGTETVQIIPGEATNNLYSGITVSAPVPLLRILDNDRALLTVSSPSLVEGNNGESTMLFAVQLSSATKHGFTVDYTSIDGTATAADNDYTPATGSLTFAGNANETGLIPVRIKGDIRVEENETFTVALVKLSDTFENELTISENPGKGTVLADDIAPVAEDDRVVAREDTPLRIFMTANDHDADGNIDTQSVVIVTAPTRGKLLLNPEGAFTYLPPKNFNGDDSFTYTVKDNTGILSNTAKVYVDVNPENDPPVAVDDSFYVVKNGELSETVAANDSDTDGDPLNFTLVTAPAHGTVTTLNAGTGSFTYAPTKGFSGTDRFTYRACDTDGACDIAEVVLNVQPRVTVNLTPSAAKIVEGNSVSITATITEPLMQDITITLGYSGTAERGLDYTLDGSFQELTIPAGKLSATQKFTISSLQDYLKEGDETLQFRIQTAIPLPFVAIGKGADVTILDFYPRDKEPEKNANADINPDPLASPNGDGKGNEKFIIHNIERYPDNEVMIFNRWGNEVYHIKGYNNTDRAFAGIANTGLLVNKGAQLVDGVYFFMIYTKDNKGLLKVNKGSVIIKR